MAHVVTLGSMPKNGVRGCSPHPRVRQPFAEPFLPGCGRVEHRCAGWGVFVYVSACGYACEPCLSASSALRTCSMNIRTEGARCTEACATPPHMLMSFMQAFRAASPSSSGIALLAVACASVGGTMGTFMVGDVASHGPSMPLPTSPTVCSAQVPASVSSSRTGSRPPGLAHRTALLKVRPRPRLPSSQPLGGFSEPGSVTHTGDGAALRFGLGEATRAKVKLF